MGSGLQNSIQVDSTQINWVVQSKVALPPPQAQAVFTETVGLISHTAHELIPILLLKTRQSLGSNRYYTLGDEAEGGSTHNIYGPTTKHEV